MTAHMKISGRCLKHIIPALPPSPYSGPLAMTFHCKHLDLLRSLLFNTSVAWYFFIAWEEKGILFQTLTHATATHYIYMLSSASHRNAHSHSSCSFSSQFPCCCFLPQRNCCVWEAMSICVLVIILVVVVGRISPPQLVLLSADRRSVSPTS